MTTGTGAAIFGCAGLTLQADEAVFFRDFDPAGFILFARNVESPHQIKALTGDLRACVGWDAPIFVDQEGGRVQRLRAPHWREWTPPLDFVAAAGPRAERAMYLRAALIGAEHLALGIDGNCAPTLDVAGDATHPFLKNRCYGFDHEQVSRIGRAVADGLLASGVLPVMKHMPGHGRAQVDTHHHLPQVLAEAETLHDVDFAPFRALSDLPLAMTAHLVFSALDPDRPATQSPEVIRVIREEIGFQGVLMSDDLNMQALSGTLAERTRASMDAGCDLALHCKGVLAEMQAVAGQAGRLTEAARARMGHALSFRHSPQLDIAALDAELRSIMDHAHG
jgi:beta-N-acetylhexosaminidase